MATVALVTGIRNGALVTWHERKAGVDGSMITNEDHDGVPSMSAMNSALRFEPQRLKGSKAQKLKGSKAQRLKGSEAQRHNC